MGLIQEFIPCWVHQTLAISLPERSCSHFADEETDIDSLAETHPETHNQSMLEQAFGSEPRAPAIYPSHHQFKALPIEDKLLPLGLASI
jgi:hypothetical protein